MSDRKSAVRWRAATGVIGGRDSNWIPLGRVVGLRVRQPKSSNPTAVSCVSAIGNKGLDEDIHAHPLSPRHVLIASNETYCDLKLQPMTLRENILVDFPTASLTSSGLLSVGREAVLWLTFQCEACGQLERRSPGLLKSIGPRRGMLGRVLRGGIMTAGDEVNFQKSTIDPMSADWRERIKAILHLVPDNRVVEFRQLALLAGVPTGYCRAFPKFLSQVPPSLAAKAQSSQSADTARLWDGTGIFDLSFTSGQPTSFAHLN